MVVLGSMAVLWNIAAESALIESFAVLRSAEWSMIEFLCTNSGRPRMDRFDRFQSLPLGLGDEGCPGCIRVH